MKEVARQAAEAHEASLRERLIEMFGLTTKLFSSRPKDQKTFQGKEFKQRQKMVEELTKNNEAWRGVETGLITQALHALHLFGNLAPSREDKNVLVGYSSFSEGERYSYSFTPVNGKLLVKITSDDFRSMRSVQTEQLPMSKLIRRLLDMPDAFFSSMESVQREGGVRLYGSPAERSTIRTTFAVKNSVELLQAVQAQELSKIVRNAVYEEAKTQADDLAAFDQTGERDPFEYEGEYLADVIEKTVLDEVKVFLKDHPYLVRQVEDVDAEISPTGITPVIFYREVVGFFGHPIRQTKRHELPTKKLSTRLPLTVKHIELARPLSYVRRIRESVGFDFSPDEEMSVTFSFYQHSFLKKHLLEKLREWIWEASPRNEREEKSEEKNVAYYLRLIGLTEEQVAESKQEDRSAMIQKRILELIQQFHPDRYAGHDQDEIDAANTLTRELLEAREMLSAAFPKVATRPTTPSPFQDEVKANKEMTLPEEGEEN